jgi:hypothetical protein
MSVGEGLLTDLDLVVLRAAHQLGVANPDRLPGTDETRELVLALGRDARTPYFLPARPPWFGLQHAADRLERCGYLQHEVGVASFHRFDERAPSSLRYWLSVTHAGRELLEQIGPLAGRE